jgi:hypothetical protein
MNCYKLMLEMYLVIDKAAIDGERKAGSMFGTCRPACHTELATAPHLIVQPIT